MGTVHDGAGRPRTSRSEHGRRADGREVSAPTGDWTGTGTPGTPPPESPATPPPPAPAPPAPPADPPPAAPPKTGKTFTQEDLDRKIDERFARDKRKYGDLDELKAKADRLDQVERERETDAEKARREAVEQAEAAAIAKVRPRLVAAEFRAAAAGRIDAERLATLTEDIDFSKYVDDKTGEVDVEKVTKKVEAWAPVQQTPTSPRPDRSQGPRGERLASVDAGREMFAARRKRPATT